MSILRLPSFSTPATMPPWSFAASRFDLGSRAYSSADSVVRIVTFSRSFKAESSIFLFVNCFVLRLLAQAMFNSRMASPPIPL